MEVGEDMVGKKEGEKLQKVWVFLRFAKKIYELSDTFFFFFYSFTVIYYDSQTIDPQRFSSKNE